MAEASSGTVVYSSTGGISGEHSTGGIEPSAVGPSTFDQFNTLRFALIPIACWRVEDLRFDFDSSFVRPDVSAEVAHLASLLKQHQGSPISLFGHADPVGDDEYNKNLSGRRAAAVYGLLTRDVELWDRLYTVPFSGDNWSNTTIADMLWCLGYPAEANNQNSPRTTQALKAFQGDHGLAANGYADKSTRTRLFQAYMDKIARDAEGNPFVLTKQDFLARGDDPDGKGDYQGCGEFCPILMFSAAENQAYQNPANRNARNEDNAPNRRVVAFVFRRGARVNPQKWPCARAKEGTQSCRKRFWSDAAKRRQFQENRREYSKDKDTFACRFYDRMASGSPCEGVLQTFRIRLFDPMAQPIAYAPYRISAEAHQTEGKADGEGWAAIKDINVPGRVTVEWGYRPFTASEPPAYVFSNKVYMDVDAPEEEIAADRRLHNLGYRTGQKLEDRVKAFQRAYGLPESGQLQAIKEDLWKYHDEVNPEPLPNGRPDESSEA